MVRNPAGMLLILLLPCALLAADDRMAEVMDRFERQDYRAALELLDDQRLADHPLRIRYQSLALYHLPDHAAALPVLEQAYRREPDDLEVLAALVDALRTQGDLDRADELAGRLIAAGAGQRGHLLRGRIAEELGLWTEAEEHYYAALDGPERASTRQAARALTDLLNSRGQYDQAIQVADEVLPGQLDRLSAAHFDGMRSSRPAAEPNRTFRLGYRLEHDDNVPRNTGNGGFFGLAERSGFRHVLTGDFSFQYPVSSRLSVFTEAYLYQSYHQDGDLSEFNFTRLSGLAGVGGTWGRDRRAGWRVPVEVAWEGLDGSRFQTVVSALPGIYVQPREGWLLNFYARLTHVNFSSPFAEPVDPNEDRGGDRWRAGFFLHANPVAGLQWRLIAEYGSDNANGANRDLDEWRVYSVTEYRFHKRVIGGAGFQYRERDFDNPVFMNRRKDDIRDGFAFLSGNLSENWLLRAQYSHQRRNSSNECFNLECLEFNRNVFSLGVSWEF